MTAEIRSRVGTPRDRHWHFKGEFTCRSHNRARVFVNVAPEDRARYPVDRHGCILRSRKVWIDAHPGSTLESSDVIHHVNGDTTDDRLENLRLYSNQSEHWREHSDVLLANRKRNERGQFI
jgi:hypothetical protein